MEIDEGFMIVSRGPAAMLTFLSLSMHTVEI